MLLTDQGFQSFGPLDQPDEHEPTIMIDDTKTFQTIIGFGGAFTDAAADTFAKLPKDAQEQFLKATFDPVEGNAYSLCRTTIHSCDFSPEMYTYDDTPGDKDLKNFSIAHDLKDRIPFIKRAIAASKGNLKLFASPWSPPAWMKTNNDMLHGGKLKPDCDQTWADYFVKYINAYKAEGVPIWGVTVQNEAAAVQVWESCVYTADEEKDFVKNFLGPTFQKDGLSDVKIMIWDHNRGLMYQRAQAAYEDPDAAKYIWGTAFHWYTGDHFDNVRMVHDAFPDKHLLYTEGGIGGDWNSAGRLAKNMILDLNNWTEGWTLWNLMCDQNNGPRHAGAVPAPAAAAPASTPTPPPASSPTIPPTTSWDSSPASSAPARNASPAPPTTTTSSPPPPSTPTAPSPLSPTTSPTTPSSSASGAKARPSATPAPPTPPSPSSSNPSQRPSNPPALACLVADCPKLNYALVPTAAPPFRLVAARRLPQPPPQRRNPPSFVVQRLRCQPPSPRHWARGW